MGPGDGLRQRVSHYRILGRLGAGGMGEVYSAFDETLKRRVALEAIRADIGSTTKPKRGSSVKSGCCHSWITPTSAGPTTYVEDGDAEWLVLELVEGTDLRTSLTAGLDAAARFRVAEQLSSALVAAHAAGVVLRDLKPGNVMVTERGDVKVLDFGLAKRRRRRCRSRSVVWPRIGRRSGAVPHSGRRHLGHRGLHEPGTGRRQPGHHGQ
jgi:serine/threonine protein kinase